MSSSRAPLSSPEGVISLPRREHRKRCTAFASPPGDDLTEGDLARFTKRIAKPSENWTSDRAPKPAVSPVLYR
jgi:hypothetical protein